MSCVNQKAESSRRRNNLAPQTGFELMHVRLTASAPLASDRDSRHLHGWFQMAWDGRAEEKKRRRGSRRRRATKRWATRATSE